MCISAEFSGFQFPPCDHSHTLGVVSPGPLGSLTQVALTETGVSHTTGLPQTTAGAALSGEEPLMEPGRNEIARQDFCTFPRATEGSPVLDSGRDPRRCFGAHTPQAMPL